MLIMLIVVYKCVVFLSFIEGIREQGERSPCSPRFVEAIVEKVR